MILVLCAAMIAITTVLGGGATEVQAASKNQKALSAYAKYLKNGKNWNDNGKYTTFTLFDTNNDGIKELVVYDDSLYLTYVYGYSSGKVKRLVCTMKDGITFYPKKKIFRGGDIPTPGFVYIAYYKYDGKKVRTIAASDVEYDGVGGPFLGESYTIQGKKATKKKFNQYIKGLGLDKGKSSWDLKMHKNTKSNRDKYLSVKKKKKAPAGSIAINSKNFPDANFRKYISTNIDQKVNGERDGYLTKKERLAVKSIECYEREIKNLKGIELFTNLQYLNCYDNKISNLDVNKNRKLTALNCYYNKISNLDVSKNEALEKLVCGGNNLSELDVSKNLKLMVVNCSDNKISSLDVSKNKALEVLVCGGNNLSELNVSKNAALRSLICYENSLSVLDVSNNSVLERLYCYNNNLSVLDVSNNPKLDRYEFYYDDNVEIIW